MNSTNLVPALIDRTPYDWFLDAVQAFQNLDIERAFGLVQFAIRQDPNQAEFHLFKAKLFETNGSDRRATIKSYEAALNLEPQNVEIILRLAQHFKAAGMEVRAAVLFQKARKLAPNHKLFKRMDVASAQANKSAGKEPDTQSPKYLGQMAKTLFSRLLGRDSDEYCRVAVHR